MTAVRPNAPTPMTRVLLVDDDAELAELVGEYLAREGFSLDAETDGTRAVDRAASGDYQLTLLDVMLPGVSGFDVLRALRATSRLPVLMLTARGDDVDKIVGLELGADDYLAKPFNPRELLARVRAVLRRTTPGAGGHQRYRTVELEIDFDAREVTMHGKRQVLTHFEFELLACLAHASGRVLSREHLMDALKGEEFESFDRSIDVHISKLRAKLEENPKEP